MTGTTSCGSSAATSGSSSSSKDVSSPAHSEGVGEISSVSTRAGSEKMDVEGDEQAHASGEEIELPVGFTPYLPLSSEPPSLTNKPRRLVWVVFGATGNLGPSICHAALEHGDYVTAVGRDIDGEKIVQGWHANCQGLVCDVRVVKTVQDVFAKARERWGRVDVIVNCAGIGVIGSCEDQDESDIRTQFDTNVLGNFNIIQQSLPYFRERQYGRYIIFSSIAGFSGIPGLGPYGATKYAVEGLVESLMYEIEPFGVKATLVEPSGCRKDGLEEYMADNLAPRGHFLMKPLSAPYQSPASPAQHAIKMVKWLGHHQPTSVLKIARVIWELAHCAHPTLRLLMGSHAVDTTRDRLRAIIEELEEWKHLNFPSDQFMGELDGGDEGDHEQERENEYEEGEQSRTEGEHEEGDNDEEGAGDEA